MEDELEFEVILNLDLKKIKLGDLIDMEEGSLKAARNFVSSCMADKEGNPIERDKALEMLNMLDVESFSALITDLRARMNKSPLAISGGK